MRILFVCTGNSCRSPMASALLKKLAKDENLNLEIDSCGLATFLGMSASKPAIEVLRYEGIDISSHKSKPLNIKLLKWADLVLTMEMKHKEKILQDYPDAKGKIFLLSEYANSENKDIIDPIGKPPEVYEAVLMDLKFYLPKVIERIKNESGNRK